ncbi:MAG TPA: patatin-like phospholipase family protein [Thermoanaerobaculia bacterium]
MRELSPRRLAAGASEYHERMRRTGISLALSGGGFRATLFHAGALLRLNELGLLSRLTRIVSVSGGSIAAGFLASRWSNLAWSRGIATNLRNEIVDPLKDFCSATIDVPAVVGAALHPAKSACDLLKSVYKKRLFGNAQLKEMPKNPTFVIQATHLSTGRAFRFYRDHMADYLIGSAPTDGISIATAVTASSAFPPILSPLLLPVGANRFRRLPGAHLHDRPEYRETLVLSDGGVYDNLGLEQAWKTETVLVSDAGAPFDFDPSANEWLRPLAIATDQSRGLRKRWLIDQYVRGVRKGAYWGIETNIAHYPTASIAVDRDAQLRLARLRTRLNAFSNHEQSQLINLGYGLSDAACRSHLGLDATFALPEQE